MKSKNWSTSTLRVLVLITGVVVILEALHLVSISITWHVLASDVRNTHNTPEILAGLAVGTLALIPSRKSNVRRTQTQAVLRWTNVNNIEPIKQFASLANFSARHMDIR